MLLGYPHAVDTYQFLRSYAPTGKREQDTERKDTSSQQLHSLKTGASPEGVSSIAKLGEASEGTPGDGKVTIQDSSAISPQAVALSSLDKGGVAAPTTDKAHARHSRKPQHVFSGKKFFKDPKRREGVGAGGVGADQEVSETLSDSSEKQEETVSFSVSVVGWGAFSGGQPSKQGAPKRGKDAPRALGGKESGYVAGEHGKKREDDGKEPVETSDSDEEDGSKSTVISLPTSLPIIFHVAASASQHGLAQRQAVRDTLVTPPSFKPKSLPVLLESIKPTSAHPQKRVSQTPAQPPPVSKPEPVVPEAEALPLVCVGGMRAHLASG